MIVGQETGDVDAVSDTSKAQGELHAHAIDNCSGKEAHDTKGAVKGDVGLVGYCGIDLASCTDAVDSVEHAGTEEADEGNEDELGHGRSVPGELERTQLPAFVHPSRGTSRNSSNFGIMMDIGVGMLLGGRFYRRRRRRGFVDVFGSGVGHCYLLARSQLSNQQRPVECTQSVRGGTRRRRRGFKSEQDGSHLALSSNVVPVEEARGKGLVEVKSRGHPNEC